MLFLPQFFQNLKDVTFVRISSICHVRKIKTGLIFIKTVIFILSSFPNLKIVKEKAFRNYT